MCFSLSNLKTMFCGIEFKNPIITASGTFGFGREYNEIYDIEKLGGLSTKGLTLNYRKGNKGIRSYESSYGLLNSVGLENPGIKNFIENERDFLKNKDLIKIANLGGKDEYEYIEGAKLLDQQDFIDIIELNISCPNVKNGGMAFGINKEDAYKITKKIKSIVNKPLVVKLSPNANDLVAVAKACEEAGADGLSLINTIKAMEIDINKKKPIFDNVYAGYSGPSVMPIALRMVHEVCKNVKIPVIGMGGITNYEDAIKFIMAGASLIQIGTANFIDQEAPLKIIDGIKNYMIEENINSLDDIRGII